MVLFLICPATQDNRDSRILPELKIAERDEEYFNSLSNEDQDALNFLSVIQTKYTIERTRDEVWTGIDLSKNFNFNKLEENRKFPFPIDNYIFEKPTVFLTGLHDNMVGFKDQFSIIDQFTDISFAVLADTGHNMQIENPEIFNTFVFEWLKRVEKKL